MAQWPYGVINKKATVPLSSLKDSYGWKNDLPTTQQRRADLSNVGMVCKYDIAHTGKDQSGYNIAWVCQGAQFYFDKAARDSNDILWYRIELCSTHGGHANGSIIYNSSPSGVVYSTNYAWINANFVDVSKAPSVPLVNVSASDTSKPASVPAGENGSSSVQISAQGTAVTYASQGTEGDWTTAFATAVTQTTDWTELDTKYYNDLSNVYSHALGSPPHYNMDIDPQYMDDINSGAGRVFSKTILEHPTLLTITPGYVQMFPYLIGSKRDNIIDALVDEASGRGIGAGFIDKLNKDTNSKFSSKTYTFKPDTATYSQFLNVLCRAVAVMMGIGQMNFSGTNVKLENFNYANWSLRKMYTTTQQAADEAKDKDKTIFRKVIDALFGLPSTFFKYGENAYALNFFMNGNETSVSESIATEVGDSPFSSVLGTINEISSYINYFTNSGYKVGGDSSEITDALKGVLSGGGSVVQGLTDLADNFLHGGKMILPKMLTDTTYGKTISINMKFISPYGTRYSIFMKCLVPICHLLALALPRQLSDNMYGYPFFIRAQQLGSFNMDLGIISSLQITRGGPDDTAYTIEGLSTEWDVQMELTPLIDNGLMITSANNPGLFAKNDALLDYLGNLCGFDVLANNFDTKVNLIKSLYFNKFFKDGIPTLTYQIMDKISGMLTPIMDVAFGLR